MSSSSVIATLASVCAAVTMVMLSSSTAAEAAMYQGAGFDTILEPDYESHPRPYVDITTDTTAVSEKVQREAVLSCSENSPVFRACNCDILTWDSCGNIYGLDGQQVDWVVTVTHMFTGEVNRLVSPVMFLRDGVARFYFTPTAIGPYNVSVVRAPTSPLPPITLTGSALSNVVLVHDVTATCSQRTLGAMTPQFQDLLWAHSQFLNEQERKGASDKYSIATNINIDRYTVYDAAKDGTLQQNIRRDPIQQYRPDKTIPRQPVEDNNMHMCDMVKHTYG